MLYVILAIFALFGLGMIFSAGRTVGKLEERAKSVRKKSSSQQQKNMAEEVEYEEIKD